VNYHTHVAGIIPLANLVTDHELDIPSCLLPVDAGFTAIQKSVFECALAGCRTIWIVANQDLAPVVRKSVGEWVYDPVYFNRNRVRFYKEIRKEIPIYYVPISERDRERRDSYGWSVLHGIYSAWWVANKISKWVVPEKYFISFPMGVYDIYRLREQRRKIANPNKNFFMTHNNHTVKANLPLPFAIRGEDYIQCRRNVNKLTTRGYYFPTEGEKYPSKKLPLHERWSARNFDFNLVFDKAREEDAEKVELDWFYNMSNWQEYRHFLGSENLVKKPYEGLIKPHIHAKMLT